MVEGARKELGYQRYLHEPFDSIKFQELFISLLYLSTRTRVDISAEFWILSRYASFSAQIYLCVIKRIIWILNGTEDYALRLYKNEDKTLTAYCYADWAGHCDDRQFTRKSGILMKLVGSSIAWRTSIQKDVSLPSAEAQFLAWWCVVGYVVVRTVGLFVILTAE